MIFIVLMIKFGFSDHDSFLVLQVKQPTESWN